MDNKDRRAAALKALKVFAADTGMVEEDLRTQITDLVTDLFHVCEHEIISVDGVFISAMQCLTQELKEDN